MKSSPISAKKISASIVKNVPLSDKYFHLSLRAPQIASIAKPGQFLMVKPDQRYHPLLPRPFSIHRIIPDFGIELLYHRVGLGTDLLSRMQPGDTMEVLGPLGNGFSIPSKNGMFLIIAGGMGIAPLPALIDTIKKLNPSSEIHLFFGAKSRNDLVSLDLCQELNCQLHLCTEDGSVGVKGLVTQVFEEFLHNNFLKPKSVETNKGSLPYTSILPPQGGGVHEHVIDNYSLPSGGREAGRVGASEADHEGRLTMAYACGPNPMLRNLSKLALDYNVSLSVSLESHMACGIGSCLGCPVKVLANHSEFGVSWSYERVCYEGPVFEASKIIWES